MTMDYSGAIEIGDDALALVAGLLDESGDDIGVEDLIAALDSDSMELGATPMARRRPGGGGGGGTALSAWGGKMAAAAGNPALQALVQRAKGAKMEKQRIRKVIEEKFAKGGTAIKPSVPIDAYGAVMNFRSTIAVPPGGTSDVFADAIETFKPDEVSLPVEIGPDFLILRIDVGMRKLYASNGPMRASLLNSTAFSKKLFQGITVQRGQPIQWLVQNTSGADRFFEATLFGQVVVMGAGMQGG